MAAVIGGSGGASDVIPALAAHGHVAASRFRASESVLYNARHRRATWISTAASRPRAGSRKQRTTRRRPRL